tara:strand:+ start:428 stop:1015 length:588 start_codon:yes stop_codon:yes gene_type:complete
MNKTIKKLTPVLVLAVLIGGGLYHKNYIYEEKDISKWKTYQDQVYNFEIKYPPHWNPAVYNQKLTGFFDTRIKKVSIENVKKRSKMNFITSGYTKGSADIMEEISKKDLKELKDYVLEYIKLYNPKAIEEGSVRLIELVTKDDRVVIKERHSDDYLRVVVMVPVRKDLFYIFTFASAEDDQGVVDKIISTFKVLK